MKKNQNSNWGNMFYLSDRYKIMLIGLACVVLGILLYLINGYTLKQERYIMKDPFDEDEVLFCEKEYRKFGEYDDTEFCRYEDRTPAFEIRNYEDGKYYFMDGTLFSQNIKTYTCDKEIDCPKSTIKQYTMKGTQQPVTGYIKGYFDDGKLYMDGFAVNGKIHGKFLTYNQQGQMIQTVHQRLGETLKAEYRVHDDNTGMLRVKLIIDEKKNTMDRYEYLENGAWSILSTDSTGKNGEMRGYHENGKRMFVVPMKNGQPHGTAKYYYKDGAFKSCEKYYNGEYIRKLYYGEEGCGAD